MASKKKLNLTYKQNILAAIDQAKWDFICQGLAPQVVCMATDLSTISELKYNDVYQDLKVIVLPDLKNGELIILESALHILTLKHHE